VILLENDEVIDFLTSLPTNFSALKYVFNIYFAAPDTLHTVTLNFWTKNWRTSYSGPRNQVWFFYTFLFLSWAPARNRRTDRRTDKTR